MVKRGSRSGQDGSIGQTSVKRVFEVMKWGPIPVTEHDDGTDFFVQIRDADLAALGMLLGVQVKNEKQYFEPAARASAASLETPGWHYRAKQDDAIFWMDHAVPHLLVLYDRDEDAAYWAHVTQDSVSWTRKGAKIWVPMSQRLTPECSGALIKIAASGRCGTAWAGSLWDDQSRVSPPARLRHALLTPRIVAPHLNRGVKTFVAEEAIASLMLGRFDELERAMATGVLPRESDRPDSLQWRLFTALESYVKRGDRDALGLLLEGQSGAPHEQVACLVAFAAACAESGDYSAVLAAIDRVECAHSDDPVDQAWVDAHKARSLLELGRSEECAELALGASAVGMLHPHDPTALVIQAACLNQVFMLNLWESKRFVEMVRANDSAPMWWRAQKRAWALSSHLSSNFHSWAGESDEQASKDWESWSNLRSVVLTTGMAADQSSWRTAARELAQQELMTSGDSDVPRFSAAVNDLCRAGAKKVLEAAVAKLGRVGPADALRSVCSQADLSQATWTSFGAYLELLCLASDLMDDESVRRHGSWALAALDNGTLVPTTAESGWSKSRELIRLLGELCHQLPDDLATELQVYLVHMAPVEDQLLAETYARLIRRIRPGSWSSESLSAVKARVSLPISVSEVRASEVSHFGDHRELTLAWLEVLAETEEPQLRTQLDVEAAAGVDDAIRSIRDLSALNMTTAEQIIEHLRLKVDERRQAFAQGKGWSLGGLDYGSALLRTNINHPEAADWEPIEWILKGPVPLLDQFNLLDDIERLSSRVPVDVAKGWVPLISEIEAVPSVLHSFIADEAKVPNAAKRARLALVNPFDDENDLFARLADGEDGRSSVARAIGRYGGEPHLPLLGSLASDPGAKVRIAASGACVRLLLRGIPWQCVQPVLDPLLESNGTGNSLAATREISEDDDLAAVGPVLERLMASPSAAVRERAAALILKR